MACDPSLRLRDLAAETGRDLTDIICQISPITRLGDRDCLASDDPYLPELRARFGARIIDGLTPAALLRHDEHGGARDSDPDSDDLDDPDGLSDLDYMVDDYIGSMMELEIDEDDADG